MIKRIRIQNFRSLWDVSVNLEPLTVLIGQSGTGKSNFVQAIRYLRDSLNVREFNPDRFGRPNVLHIDHMDGPISYYIHFSIDRNLPDFHYTLIRNTNTGNYDEILELGDRKIFQHNGARWIVPPSTNPQISITGVMLGAIPGLQESTLAYVALRSGIGCYDFPSEVLLGNGKDGHPTDNGFADRANNYLFAAERIITDLRVTRNWNMIVKGLKSVNANVQSLTLNLPETNRIDVGLRHSHGKAIPIDVRQESEGFRRYLAHLIALYQNPSKQTVVFEHPETGLHPAALEALAGEFNSCPEDGRGQVILTTHSPQLLDYFPVDSIRVVTMNDQMTRIDPLHQDQVEVIRDKLMRPGELLTVDEARPAELVGAA